MTSLADLRVSVEKLIEKIDQIIEKGFITTDQLEAIAAKIIIETQKEIQKCPCNQEIIEKISKTSTVLNIIKTEEEKPFEGKYSYPNYLVGNEELGSSKNPSSLSWPDDYYKPK